jgi:SAM-dependent methyltransferase
LVPDAGAVDLTGSTQVDLEALLYDWHNANRLVDQQADVGYWVELVRPLASVLVLGAGTGRVAAPLASCGGGLVVALDLSLSRVRRIPGAPRLARVCGDMRLLPFRREFDGIVIPYSAFQLLETAEDRRRAVRMAASLLAAGGNLYIDVSTSFDRRPSAARSVVLKAYCEELGVIVTEIEECRRESDAMVIEKEFRSPRGELLCAVRERWSYFSSIDFSDLLRSAAFEVMGIDQGYGGGKSPQRRVVRARHEASVPILS